MIGHEPRTTQHGQDGRAARAGSPCYEELEETYTDQWFRERFRYRSPYHRFAEAILEVLKPESLADVGCGMAWTIEYLEPRIPCIGIEGSRAALRLMRPHVRRLVHLSDLRGPPIPQMADYELIVSFEVAEHIDGPHVGTFLTWCTQAKRLLMSAAPPGQGGNHHVSEHPAEWWQEWLDAMGWRYDETVTRAWRTEAKKRTKGCPWVVRNTMYFEREGD